MYEFLLNRREDNVGKRRSLRNIDTYLQTFENERGTNVRYSRINKYDSPILTPIIVGLYMILLP